MNCVVDGSELKAALSALGTPTTVTLSLDGLSVLSGEKLFTVRLDSLLPVGDCEPVTIPPPATIPDEQLDILSDCGVVMVGGEPAFDTGEHAVLKHPPFESSPWSIPEAVFNRVLPFVTWEGSTISHRPPLWYMRVLPECIQATDSRMLITQPLHAPGLRCYLLPMPTQGAVQVRVEGRWIEQVSGQYRKVHKYTGQPWPECPTVTGEPDRLVEKLPEGIRIHDHELRAIERALGSGYKIELRLGQPIVFRRGGTSVMVLPLKEKGE